MQKQPPRFSFGTAACELCLFRKELSTYEKKTLPSLRLASGPGLRAVFISFSVVAVLHFRPLYYFDIKALGVEETSGLPEEEIRANYDALIDYNSLSWHGCLQFPTLPMSEGGRIHFEEVRTIFVFVQYLCIVSFLAAAVGGFSACAKGTEPF